MIRLPHLLLGLVLSVIPATAQVVVGSLPLSDGDPTSPDYSWGIALHADGRRAYVSCCGSLGTNNDDLLLVDTVTGAIQAQATVGLFPEDVATVLDASGAVREVWVVASSAGTVSALTPDLSSVVTIPLASCGSPAASAYPFGVTASPDGTRVVVTSTACDRIDVVDSDPASPTRHQVVASLTVPGAHGRPVWVGPWTLLLPTTRIIGSYSASEAGCTVIDLQAPAQPTWIPVLPPPLPGTFDNATDAALLPNGRVLVTAGFGQSGRLVEVDPVAGVVTRSLDLSADPGVLLHGLAVDPVGDLAVVTSFAGNSALGFVDVANFAFLGSLSLGANLQPNEVVFTRDAQRLLVTCQNSAQVVMVGDLPLRRLSLNASPTIVIGQDVWSARLDGIEAGRYAAVYASVTGPGPTLVDGDTVWLAQPFELFSLHQGGVDGGASESLTLGAPLSYLSGLSFWFQGVTLDESGRRRLSNPAMTTLL